MLVYVPYGIIHKGTITTLSLKYTSQGQDCNVVLYCTSYFEKYFFLLACRLAISRTGVEASFKLNYMFCETT